MSKPVVRDLLKLRKCVGDLGVEIEVEGDNLPSRKEFGFWKVEDDGSLRGESAEFVLRRPVTKDKLAKALEELTDAFKEYDTNLRDTSRAGVHVHVNVQELTKLELFNFITVYLLLENLLVKWCGNTREGNLFCLRCSDAEAWLQYVEDAIKRDDLRILHHDDIRYASINLKALCQYGSVEFRAMRSTNDLDLIYKWACLLQDLRDFSKNFHNPIEVVDYFIDNQDRFVREALGEHYKDFTYVGYLKILEPCVRFANDLAHYSTWKEVAKKFIGGLPFEPDVEFPDEPEDDF